MTPRDARTPAPDRQPPQLRFSDVESADGTRIRAWTNDAEGPVVLLCNGLGTNPYAWPDLLRPDCGVRLLSWNHRGVGGSQRPADRARVGVGADVEDALAVLDGAGVESCVVMSWSLGVNTAVELAVTCPEQVNGLLVVAGVPGSTYWTMGEPLPVPRFVRHGVAVGAARVLHRTGGLLSPVTRRIPMTTLTTGALRHSGLMSTRARHDTVAAAVKEFLTTDVDWYMHLVLASSRHRHVPLSGIRVPTTFVAGKQDLLAGISEVRTAAERIPGARLVEVDGTHFLPLERGQEIRQELLDLVGRATGEAVRTAARG